MKAILSKLYNGELSPAQGSYSKEKDYKLAAENFEKLSNKLQNLLPDDATPLYHELTTNLSKKLSLEAEQAFVNAFRLGALVMLEILSDNSTD